ncbi:uncharacterized protein VTP21DRAFT_6179 [Calcarisporiella thermophila]|uniref:uncharacterized protein n=1 Tax=Calcarisporiella thermophila TaxID=911321 RepID=UPI003742B651
MALDILDPSTFHHHIAQVNGIRMHYVDENPQSTNVILCCHGWPDLWYGWRHQIPFLTKKGYRVIVPDMRGFGQTEAPSDYREYGFGVISKDIASLLDHLNIPKVILLGHDWGGSVVWRFTQFYPERVIAVASFCTPYRPQSKEYVPLEDIIQQYPNFDYQAYLITPEAEAEFTSNPDLFFRFMLRPPGTASTSFYNREKKTILGDKPADIPKASILPQQVLDYYIDQYKKSGFRGGLNWYKLTKINWEQCKDLDPVISHKALMVGAGKDVALPPRMLEGMQKFIPNVEIKVIEDSGHWILWEKPELVNAYLDEWLDKLKDSNASPSHFIKSDL